MKVASRFVIHILVRRMSSWDLTFLGTGAAYPSPSRGASCMVLRIGHGGWLFDCGEGSQVQLMRSTIKPSYINKIFITHLHGDHVFGLPGLLCTISGGRSEDSPPLEVFGPVGLRMLLRTNLNLARSQLQFKYMVHELLHDVGPGDYDRLFDWCPQYEATGQCHYQEILGRNISKNMDGYWPVCEDGTLTVKAGILHHRIASFGYVVTEDPLPGKLLVDKLKVLEVPPGPCYAKLKQGESILSPKGVKITPSDVLGPSRPGRKIVILGDTYDSSSIIPIAKDADLLVHEATNENSHEERCIENGHSTPRMAARFCHSIAAKKMILTHFSQRYKSTKENPESDLSVKILQREAVEELRRIDPNSDINVSTADDFKVYVINANK